VELTEDALVGRFSTDPDSIARETRRLRGMGLVEGRHISAKTTEGGMGYVSSLREGLRLAAWLSVQGSNERQKLAAVFIEYILPEGLGGRR
jgi:hypothetical protein